LCAHAAAHGGDEAIVALGILQPAVAQDGFFGVVLRGWLEEMSEPLRENGYRYSCFDVLSGHFSIRREDFKAVGGFDSALRCREDYELGYRINAAGLRFQVVRGANAKHHDTTDLAKAMRRKFDEGMADVAICARHLALAHALPLRRKPEGSRMTPLLYWLAWHYPVAGDLLASCVARMLPVYEFWRLRYRWRMRVEDLLAYWYWRGIATAAGSRDRLEALMSAASMTRDACTTVDLGAGLEAAETQLDRVRPVSVRFVYGRHFVGELPETPGAEPIRGVHLRRIIARQFVNEYLRAACLAGALPEFLLNPALEQRLLHPPDPQAES
jgi:hypothetical protein